ncbi:MAG: outer membrane lipoprotein-sorting protein [Polyangiales bacterium]
MRLSLPFGSALLLGVALLAPLAVTSDLRAADDAPEAIMKRALDRDGLGLEGGHATLTMTIGQDDGSTEARSFEAWSKRTDGLLRSKIVFRAPAKIAGMSFLLLQRKDLPDEQYVYLPAYKKVRRITSKERTGAFGGSDFTYADLERREVKDARYEKRADEDVGKEHCVVIDALPTKAADSIYAHVTTWLRKDDDVPLRTQFFGLDGKLEKTLFTKKLKTIDGKAVVTLSRLERAGSKRFTELSVDAIDFKVDAPDAMFTEAALSSGE